jgi:tetratricopeptide (TPR) repeat protein
MELLYNPDLMSEEDIKATFVARQKLIDRLVQSVRTQPEGAGVQHAVIIAPRGMGKTTVLLMLQFAIKESELSKQWIVVRFPEERYNIYDLADLWVEILTHLANDTSDVLLRSKTEGLKTQFVDSSELQEASLALIKDWSKSNGKRIVVLIDNLDEILDQIGDERENARLRDALMNDGTLMIIGGATTFFREARAYEQPLYNFFRTYSLDDFSFDEIVELLLKRADREKRTDLEGILEQNKAKLHALKYFTGGNPRLVLMLYDVIAKSNLSDVRAALEKLLDEVTPYFKAKVETLPAQQRKIIDYIAAISGETNEGLSPSVIAAAVRMSPNQVSSQLKRLAEAGYVKSANLRGRSAYYSLSEPLFSIWHQMRSGRNSRERRRWLVSILRALYSSNELGKEQDKLDHRFLRYVRDGQVREARDTLEHKLCLIEAAGIKRNHQEVESVISCYLELEAFDSLKAEISPEILSRLSDDTLHKLLLTGCISAGQFEASKSHSILSPRHKAEAEAAAEFMLGRMAVSLKTPDEEKALEHFSRCTELNPGHHDAWINKTIALRRLNRLDDALMAIETTLAEFPECYRSEVMRGDLLELTGRLDDAVSAYDLAIKIDPNQHPAWCHRNSILFDQGRFEEVVEGTKHLIEIDPKDACAWANQGAGLGRLGRHEEAVRAYRKAVALDRSNLNYRLGMASNLGAAGHYDDAIKALDQVLAKDDQNEEAWQLRGRVSGSRLVDLAAEQNLSMARRSLEEAVASFRKAGIDDWPEFVSSILLQIMAAGKTDFVRDLILSSSLERELFPLLRAIEYRNTHDNGLIERLAPEVKGLVTSIINEIEISSKNSRRVPKSRNGSKPRRKAH